MKKQNTNTVELIFVRMEDEKGTPLCNCGSGQDVMSCTENSQFCG